MQTKTTAKQLIIHLFNFRSLKSKISIIFPAVKSRDFKIYFSGQIISLAGTWVQIVALGWLVLQLKNSSFYLGLVAAASTVPSLLFSLVGGALVDRFSKKNILLVTQYTSMFLAFSLGILNITNSINIFEVILISFLLGCVNAVDSPARQSFVAEIVNKDNLQSAIALNSAAFNATRIIGPAVAGFLISLFGTGGAFITNSLSYVAVIIALNMIKTKPVIKSETFNTINSIKQGLIYTIKNSTLRNLLVFGGIISLFGWPLLTILPMIARDYFNSDAKELGYLFAAAGFGTLLASVMVSAFSKKIDKYIFIFGGGVVFSIAIILFSLSANMQTAIFLLFLYGFGILTSSATINSTIQCMIHDNFRGRVMSIFMLVFMGLAPLGNLQIGFLSENYGIDFAIRLGALTIFSFALIFLSLYKRDTANKIFI